MCEKYADLTADWGERWQMIASAMAAVTAVHVVIGVFLWKVYRQEIEKEE